MSRRFANFRPSEWSRGVRRSRAPFEDAHVRAAGVLIALVFRLFCRSLVGGPSGMVSTGMRVGHALVGMVLCVVVAGCSSKGSSAEIKPMPASVMTTAPTPLSPQLPIGEHTVNVESESSPGLLLYRVTVDETSTKLDFTFTNKGARATNVTVAPTGDKHAMFLEWGPEKKARFQSATGIAISPKQTTIPAGQSLSFSLTFGPLDVGVTTFDMYEGEDAKKVMPGAQTYWVMREIRLK